MREVRWTDEDGFEHRSLIRDHDSDEMAPHGVPLDTFSVEDQIDWESVKRELHNLLVKSGLLTWEDVMRSQHGLKNISYRVFKPHLVRMFKEMNKDG